MGEASISLDGNNDDKVNGYYDNITLTLPFAKNSCMKHISLGYIKALLELIQVHFRTLFLFKDFPGLKNWKTIQNFHGISRACGNTELQLFLSLLNLDLTSSFS